VVESDRDRRMAPGFRLLDGLNTGAAFRVRIPELLLCRARHNRTSDPDVPGGSGRAMPPPVLAAA